MNKLSKSLILLFSELIWIYYFIALFTRIEWESTLFVNFTWWVVAAVVGYLFNRIFAGRAHYITLIVVNGMVISFLIFQNWRLVALEESIFFGIFISAVIGFIFLRSAFLAFKEQTRRQMLYHFEANIIIYALLAFVFTENEIFHAVFLFAIFLSLMGMVLVLQNHAQDESDSDIEVHKVGRSGWFSAIIGLLLACVTLASFLLFLPSIRQILQSIGTSGLAGLTWMYNQFVSFLTWLFRLFPEAEMGGNIEDMEPGGTMPIEEMPEETIVSLPPGLLIAGAIILCILVISVIVWIASRYLKKWQPPRQKKAQRFFTFNGSWWKQLLKSFKLLFKRLQRKWRVRFSRYYKETVYWYFYKVQRWGKRNGIRRLYSETTKEYTEKIIVSLNSQTDENLSADDKKQLIAGLRKLNQEYQAAYYGYPSKPYETEYRSLLEQLKGLKLNRKEKSKLSQS